MAILPDTILMPGLSAVRVSPECAVVPNVLTDLLFSALKDEAARFAAIRSGTIGRNSGAVPYSALQGSVLAGVYGHSQMLQLVERVVGEKGLVPLSEGNELACSLLVYEKPGDRIGYHYDRNHYQGKTFTVLYTVVNDGSSSLVPSSNRTCIWTDRERCLATQPNSLFIMNGSEVLHSAKPLGDMERRVVLSMVYTTDPSQTLLQAARQRVKNWSFGF